MVFGVPGARGVFSAQFGPGETELIFWGFFTLFSCSKQEIFVSGCCMKLLIQSCYVTLKLLCMSSFHLHIQLSYVHYIFCCKLKNNWGFELKFFRCNFFFKFKNL